ncbi:AAA family ATPase [Synechococcus sp. MU1611]|nr:AAA family ATPase [Synechococcus sp. MU1650]MCB4411645.1 AAA family ATPase [Synechococcus sp. MU1611]
MGTMRHKTKGKRAQHVIVIAGASGTGKTQLIQKLSQKPHDHFRLKVLKQLGCDPNQRMKRSTVERMQRLMDPANFKKRKTRKLKYCLLLHIDLTSINHKSNLKLLRKISKRSKRVDIITLYTSPKEWRQRIFKRLHTEDEPSMRAALIALTTRINKKLSDTLYHREYTKWLNDLEQLRYKKSAIINTFNKTILTSIPQVSR